MKFTKDDLYSLKYKTSFSDPFTTISIRQRCAVLVCHLLDIRQISNGHQQRLPQRNQNWQRKKKLADVKAMLKFMTPTDKRFLGGSYHELILSSVFLFIPVGLAKFMFACWRSVKFLVQLVIIPLRFVVALHFMFQKKDFLLDVSHLDLFCFMSLKNTGSCSVSITCDIAMSSLICASIMTIKFKSVPGMELR